jgi:uncharacterized protein involved in type VI secretion and phage assembly
MIAPPDSERELDEELRLHCDLLTERYKQSGLSAEEARRRCDTNSGNGRTITAGRLLHLPGAPATPARHTPPAPQRTAS